MKKERQINWTARHVLVACCLVAVSAVRAADITWTNEAGGDFSNPLNWESNQVPGTADRAVFNIETPEPYTVTWSEPITNYSFKVEQGALIWNLDGNKYTVTYGGPVLGVAGKTLDMVITNGQLAVSDLAPYYGIKGNTRVRGVETSGNLGRLWANGIEDGATLIVDGATLGPARYKVNTGGNLVITNNGSLDAGSGKIEYSQGSVVRMSGTGSWTRLLNMTIDCGTSGGVYLSDGALIKVWGSSGKLGMKSGSHVFLDNGQLFDKGTLTIEGGVIVGRGTVGSTTYNGGWLRPGGMDDVGTIKNVGDFYNYEGENQGSIEIKLGGTAVGASDCFVVDGTLYAGGVLDIRLLDGYRPASGDTFKILDFTTADSEFDVLNLPSTEANWDVSQLYVTGEIRYRPIGTVLRIY